MDAWPFRELQAEATNFPNDIQFMVSPQKIIRLAYTPMAGRCVPTVIMSHCFERKFIFCYELNTDQCRLCVPWLYISKPIHHFTG